MSREGWGGRRGERSCRALSRPLCTRGRSQVQVWSARLGSPPSPSSLPFAFPFPPLSGKALSLGGGVRHSFSKVCTEEPHGLFSPPPEYPKMLVCWGCLLGSIMCRQFLAWTSSGKPVSTLCAMTPASDYAAHFWLFVGSMRPHMHGTQRIQAADFID